MIVIKLLGGLGNQLFQICTVLGYHWEHQTEVGIQLSLLGNYSYFESWKRPLYFNNLLKNVKKYLKDSFTTHYQYTEPGFHYNKIPTFTIPSNHGLVLNGYFQSYKYFDRYQENILEILDYQKYKREIMDKYPLENYQETISLHFRIGDYASKPKCHPLLPLSYYQKSLELIQTKNLDKRYRVIYFYEKADKELVDKHIGELREKLPKITFIEVEDGYEDWEEMLLMSCCSNNIIANSSFSWWGAYLNRNKEKIVCYPSLWFGPKLSDKDTKDLCPDSWNKIIV